MIKILYIINNLKSGGAQKHLLEVIRGLDRKEFEPWLVILEEGYFVRLEGVKIITLGIKRIYDLNGFLGLVKLIRLMRKNKFDVMHSYLFNENILGSIAAKLTGVPLILTSRRDADIFFEKKLHCLLLYRLTNIFVDKIICVSEAVKNAVIVKENASLQKIEVVYNGVDVEKFGGLACLRVGELKKALSINNNENVIGMISNANSQAAKGHKDFIAAAQIILNKEPNVKFLLAGDGPVFTNLKSQVKNYNIEDKILFLGVRKDIPELLSIMDVSVNASYSEGMSNTILQSMASGVPVVATAVDGNLETVVDGVTGILVPPKNPQKMAEAIIKILKDKELAKEMGKNARKVIEEKFTNQIMLGNIESLYKRLLKKKIAFIFSQFPCYDETFILREMNELKAVGLDFVIYSIKTCRDKVIHQEAVELRKRTSYLPLFSFNLLFINLFFALRHPFKYWSAFLQMFFGNLKSANFFVKSMGLWMQAVGFAWLARQDKVFHVHGQWATFPATQAFIISRLNNIPFSFTGHAHDIFVDTTGLKQKIKKAKFVVTCTEYNKKYLLNLVNSHKVTRSQGHTLEDKIIVNYHGVDLERFKYQPKNQGQSPKEGTVPIFRILSVGSLLECKGFDVLIAACKILKDRGVNFECTIAGGGPLERSLKSQATSHKLDNKIQFTGYIAQEKLIPLYKEADVFALPMRSKIHWGIPNVLLEAGAAKVPVICTHLPSIPELIENNKTGFIVPENNPQALAEALLRLYENRELGEEAGARGYIVVSEKFDIKKNALNIKGLFKLNVLFIIPSLELGGAERVVINLAKGIDKKKFNPLVCCLNEKGRFAEELEKEGIKIIALNKKGPCDIGVISKLVKVMRENHIDVVNTHLWSANFWGRIAARKAGVKTIIATEHNVDVWKNWLYFALDRWLAHRTDKIIAVSNSVMEFYVGKGIPEEKIEVIYNGINTPGAQSHKVTTSQVKEEFRIKDGETVLAIIGRLVEQKGHRFLFEALHQLDGRCNIKLLVVGEGSLLESLKSHVSSHKLNDKVIFTGLRKDVKDILAETDILVMPSTREGLPMVALEAMAAGVPIVAAKVGGIPELVVDGQTGILIEPENTDALKDALIRIIEDKSLTQQFRDNAKKRVEEEFSLAEMLNKTQNLYEQSYKNK